MTWQQLRARQTITAAVVRIFVMLWQNSIHQFVSQLFPTPFAVFHLVFKGAYIWIHHFHCVMLSGLPRPFYTAHARLNTQSVCVTHLSRVAHAFLHSVLLLLPAHLLLHIITEMVP